MASDGAGDTSDSGNGKAASKLVARVGRERQRYAEDGERLIAGCIPIRSSADGDVEVLMVSSRRGEGLIFPKGGWENDETAEEAAARESLEEAGVRGDLQGIGSFEFMSKSSQRKCVAHVFVMKVTEELSTWPEQDLRSRSWCAVPDAIAQCRHDWMKSALKKWASSLSVGGGAGGGAGGVSQLLVCPSA